MKATPAMLLEMKRRGEKIAALTSYDFFTTKLLDEAGVPLILVGDSLGMVLLGHENTLSVKMPDMLHHVRAVARAKPQGLVIADMPIRSYRTVTNALRNAHRFLDAGAEGVKIEGGEAMVEQVTALRAARIPVLGHIGLLPQSVRDRSGYRRQGKTPDAAEQLVRDAQALERAGVFAIVVECVVPEVAKQITAAVSVPTIGIGAGPDCDGQILVVNDVLGLGTYQPKHAQVFGDVAAVMRRAFADYRQAVVSGSFPRTE